MSGWCALSFSPHNTVRTTQSGSRPYIFFFNCSVGCCFGCHCYCFHYLLFTMSRELINFSTLNDIYFIFSLFGWLSLVCMQRNIIIARNKMKRRRFFLSRYIFCYATFGLFFRSLVFLVFGGLFHSMHPPTNLPATAASKLNEIQKQCGERVQSTIATSSQS